MELLSQFRKWDRFCRRCLQNLRGRPREEERSHLRKVAPPKAPPKTWLQILGESLNKGLAVFRPLLPLLFGFHDTASDLPIGGSHQPVHASSGSVSGSLKQRDNIVTDFTVLKGIHVVSKVTFCLSVNGNDGELLPPQAQPTARKVCVKVCVKGRPEGRFCRLCRFITTLPS